MPIAAGNTIGTSAAYEPPSCFPLPIWLGLGPSPPPPFGLLVVLDEEGVLPPLGPAPELPELLELPELPELLELFDELE